MDRARLVRGIKGVAKYLEIPLLIAVVATAAFVFFLHDSNQPQSATACVKGALTVTKQVNLSGAVNGNSITENFTITVTGPSHRGGISKTFTLSGGTVTPTKWELKNLTLGTYTVTEVDPGPEWTVSGTGTVNICKAKEYKMTVTNTFVPGSLKVTKVVDLGGVVNGNSLTENFTITVTGPSYPAGVSKTFTLSGGSVTPPEWNLTKLIPGTYSVSEADPGPEWTVSGEGEVVVNPGSTTSATVTNTFVPGSLKVTKAVELGGVVNGGSINKTFDITVTGPSYPSGEKKTFTLSGGSVTPSEWNLTGLIPGTYNVSEDDPGAEWLVSGEGEVVVNPGSTTSATVTNTFVPGSLIVTKEVELGGVVNGNSITEDFIITVKGPSYPAGVSKTFTLSGGSVTPSEWNLTNLIPGTYNVSEDDPGPEWTVSGGGEVVVNPGSAPACATITNTFVPGSLRVTKVVNAPEGITENFTITVTGPSYPAGVSMTFTLSGGIVTPPEWNLTGLIPGTYNVSEADPGPEWLVSGGGDVEVNPGSTTGATVTNDYQEPPQEPRCSIGDTVWLDKNGNGVQDTGEPGIEGVVVQLWKYGKDSYVFVGETVTDSKGLYEFTGLYTGCYTVIVVGENFEPGGALYGLVPTYDYDGGRDNRADVCLDEPDDYFLDADFGYRSEEPPPVPAVNIWGIAALLVALASSGILILRKKSLVT